MNVNPANSPPGWKAEWSPQYARYFYVNLTTNESTWSLPAAPPPQPVQRQHSIQRKPVQSQPSPTQGHTSNPIEQVNYIETYPTPPPQVTTGYFPSAPAAQQLPQAQYTHVPATIQLQNPQQQFPHVTPQQQPQYAQFRGPAPQQLSPATQSPGSTQQQLTPQMQQQYFQQQRNYIAPAVTSNSAAHQHPQQIVQTLSPPPTPSLCSPQSPAGHAVAPYSQPQNYPQAAANSHTLFAPQKQGAAPYYPQQAQPPQQANYFVQPQQQSNNFTQPSPQYQQQIGYPNQVQGQAQPKQQTKRSSTMGGSLIGGNMMNKMSSKFTQLQQGVAGPPTAAHPNGKPADWKKWGKRAAIGVAGIGALALGADAAGDMFSGAEGLAAGDWSGGGGDFTGGGSDFTGFEGSGDAAGVMDAQTALEANNAQLTMEGIGQENASMLLDPVGTEYAAMNDAAINDAAASQASMGLI